MNEFCRSERLILRPVNVNDAASIFEYRKDSETNKYQGWIPENIDEVKHFILNRVSSVFDLNGTWYQVALILKYNNEIIGDIGIHFIDSVSRQVELGCTVSKKYQQRGYATESMSAVIDSLFHKSDKHRITASVDPRNTASIRLLKKLKFRKEAHFKESILTNGCWSDDLIYAILKDEWLTKAKTLIPD